MTATQTWRLRKERHALSSERRPVCPTVHFPPPEVCNACGAPQHSSIMAALPAFTLPAGIFAAVEMTA